MYYRLKSFGLFTATLLLSLNYPLWPGVAQVSSVMAQEPTTQKQVDQVAQWQQFTSTEGGFRVSFPGTPTEKISPGNPTEGLGESREFSVILENQMVGYRVLYTNFTNAPSQLSSEQMNQIFDGARDDLLRKDRLLSERNISLNGYPGREIEIETTEGLQVKARFYWANQRLYELLIVATNNADLAQGVDQFFNSFRLLEGNASESSQTSAEVETSETRKAEADRLYEEGVQQYQQQGRYREASQTLRQALAIYREISDKSGIGWTLTRLGSIYRTIGDFNQAVEVCEEALAIFREIDDRFGEGVILDYLGTAYSGLGQYQQALEFEQQALTIFQELDIPRSEGIALSNIGLIYINLKEYEEAIQIYQQALVISQEIGDRPQEAVILDYMGIVYQFLRDYQEALKFHQQALAIFKEVGIRRSEAIVLENIGQVYIQLGDKSQALQSLEQALAIYREIGDQEGINAILQQIEIVQPQR